jgi:hypothetical protein
MNQKANKRTTTKWYQHSAKSSHTSHNQSNMFSSFGLLLCGVVTSATAAIQSCSTYRAIQGSTVTPNTVLFAANSGLWSSGASACSSVHPNAEMVTPFDVSIGRWICDLFGDNYQWAGLHYNSTNNWTWVDGTPESARPAPWELVPKPYNDCTIAPCGMSYCAEIDCDYSDSRGKLYMAQCNKPQQVICQVNSTFLFTVVNSFLIISLCSVVLF